MLLRYPSSGEVWIRARPRRRDDVTDLITYPGRKSTERHQASLVQMRESKVNLKKFNDLTGWCLKRNDSTNMVFYGFCC